MLFADFLNYALEQEDITKYKLAKRLGISQTTVANWLDGTTEPRQKKRKEILDLFSVTEFDLEEGFPKVRYKDEQKENPTPDGAGLVVSQDDMKHLAAFHAADEDTKNAIRLLLAKYEKGAE